VSLACRKARRCV